MKLSDEKDKKSHVETDESVKEYRFRFRGWMRLRLSGLGESGHIAGTGEDRRGLRHKALGTDLARQSSTTAVF
ncbi:hypothetical protein E2C01_047600 [Portunus trituberculatus]|uniref:Uncharacterized protein n=1 Tax=Portunus trituberculatus TaxID=210409 RepID=A0A5B7G427_PORTR|nr:hypothetical protein [Portunus trituberculatus]